MVERHREGGFAVVMSLVALFLVSVALALMAVSMRLEVGETLRAESGARLTALSDSALAMTLARLAVNRGGYGGLRDEALDGGTMTTQVQQLAGGRMRIVATVRYRGRVRVTEALAGRSGQRLYVLSWRRVPGGGQWRQSP